MDDDSLLRLDDDHEEDSNDTDSSSYEHFDIRLPGSHLYLKSSELGELSAYPIHKDAGASITVPLLAMETVLLPGQTLPLHFTSAPCVNFIREMAQKHSYFCLISILTNHDEEDYDYFLYQAGIIPSNSISGVGTLFEVKNIGADDDRLTIQAVGRQRCRLAHPPKNSDILYRSYKCLFYSLANVIVLDEIELSPSDYYYFPDSRSLNRLPAEKRKNYLSFLTHHSALAIQQSSTVTAINRLKDWLQKWFDISRINVIINQSYTVFSYWVASNLPVDLRTKLALLEESSTDKRLCKEWQIASQITSLVCSLCNDVKFDVDDLLNLSVEGNGTHFVNPNGVVHEMFTVSRVNNVMLSGSPSTEFSWFPGYAWTILNCSICGCHIGWRFSSPKLIPRKFYGITRQTLKLVKQQSDDS